MSMYKKVLVILHDSILPYMGDPTLMIDFLTAAYSVGESESVQPASSLLRFVTDSPINMVNKYLFVSTVPGPDFRRWLIN